MVVRERPFFSIVLGGDRWAFKYCGRGEADSHSVLAELEEEVLNLNKLPYSGPLKNVIGEFGGGLM